MKRQYTKLTDRQRSMLLGLLLRFAEHTKDLQVKRAGQIIIGEIMRGMAGESDGECPHDSTHLTHDGVVCADCALTL